MNLKDKLLHRKSSIDQGELIDSLSKALSGNLAHTEGYGDQASKDLRQGYSEARQQLLSRVPAAAGGLSRAIDQDMRKSLQVRDMARKADLNKFLADVATESQMAGMGIAGGYIGNLQQMGLQEFLAAKARKAARSRAKAQDYISGAGAIGQAIGLAAGGG